MEKLVSVVIPVYNAERFIKNCLDGLRTQDYSNFEVVIIDDGSIDATAKIVKEYIISKGLKTWHVHSIPNNGAANARNVGIARSRGEYLCFVDADDSVAPSYIRNMVDCLESYGADLCISGHEKIYCEGSMVLKKEKNSLAKRVYSPKSQVFDDDNLFVNGYVHPCWGKMYKKHIIDDFTIGFPRQILSEDTLFNLEYLKHADLICTTDAVDYNYVINAQGNSLTKTIPDGIIPCYRDIQQRFEKLFIEENKGDKVVTVRRMMYAQYYSAVYKILLHDNYTWKCKRNQLDTAFADEGIVSCFLIDQNNSTLNSLNWLLIKRLYFTAFVILRISLLRRSN